MVQLLPHKNKNKNKISFNTFRIGTVYAPIIPVLATVTSFFLFYVKKWTVIAFGEPPKKLYSSSAQEFYFLLFLAVTSIIMGWPVWFYLTAKFREDFRVPCGPFSKDYVNAWDAIPAAIKTDVGFSAFVNVIGSVSFLIPLLAFLW